MTELHHLDEPTAHNDDAEKVPLALLPVASLIEIARVLGFGAKKYAPNNWTKGMAWSRHAGSLLRHMYAWLDGEDNDRESGLPHLAHAGCRLLYLIYYQKYRVGTDDRVKAPCKHE